MIKPTATLLLSTGCRAFIAAAMMLASMICLPGLPMAQDANSALGTEEHIGDGFRGKVYFLPEGTSSLPEDFGKLEPEGVIYTDTLNVSPRAFDKGFPGVTDRFEWFAIEYKTRFHALRSGEYTFRINSDDGTKLFIDGELVIENDGIHPPRSRDTKVELTGGAHEMVVQYFQGPRNRIALELFYAPAKGEEAIFPGTDFTLSTPGRSPALWWWLVGLGGIFLIILAGYLHRQRKKQAEEPPQEE